MLIRRRKNSCNYFISLCIAFAISSCTTQIPSKEQSNPFDGRNWYLEAIDGIPMDSSFVKIPFITFDTNGRFSGNLGCNNYFGTYMVLNKKKIDMSYAGSTKMLCAEMEIEKRFAAALKTEISHYQIMGDTLIILEKNREVLRFVCRRGNEEERSMKR